MFDIKKKKKKTDDFTSALFSELLSFSIGNDFARFERLFFSSFFRNTPDVVGKLVFCAYFYTPQKVTNYFATVI
jgi:hypothetical protein